MSDPNQKKKHGFLAALQVVVLLTAVFFTAGLLAVCGCDTMSQEPQTSTAGIANELLTSNGWFVSEVRIKVEDAPLPPALLAGARSEDDKTFTGTFNLSDVFDTIGQPYEPLPLVFADRVVLEDTGRLGRYEDLGSRYNVLDGEYIMFGMRDTPNLLYTFEYREESENFVMLATDVDAQKTVQAWNLVLSSAISSGAPDAAAGAIVDTLYDNEQIRAAIDEALTDLLNGRVEGRPDLIDDPEAAASALAALLISASVTSPGVTIKELADALVPVIETLQQAVDDGVEELVPVLVDELIALGGEYINTALPPEELQRMISLALYEQIEARLNLMNSVRSVEIILKKGEAHAN
jgi:hypothetical protein